MEDGQSLSGGAATAKARNAVVLPLCGQLQDALCKPEFVTDLQWSSLSDPEHSVAVVLEIVKEYQHTPAAIAKRLRSELGHASTVVCMMGGQTLSRAGTEQLVKAIAAKLFEGVVGSTAVFVTEGIPGVQKIFAEQCHDHSRVLNLLHTGQSCGYQRGTHRILCKDESERQEVFGLIGDIYITLEGSVGVGRVATAAHKRGAAVLPVLRTGLASTGMYGFPSKALKKPAFLTDQQWSPLTDENARVEDAANGVLAYVSHLTPPAAAAQHLRNELESRERGCRIICISGGNRFGGADTKALVEIMADKLKDSMSSRAFFVTEGRPGVQQAFAERFDTGTNVLNLVCQGQKSGYSKGTDREVGITTSRQMQKVFGLIGDIYITVEGGRKVGSNQPRGAPLDDGVVRVAKLAQKRGAVVVPLGRTGWASGGLFGFPKDALQQPRFSTREQWSLLSSYDAPLEKSAEAVVDIVKACAKAMARVGSIAEATFVNRLRPVPWSVVGDSNKNREPDLNVVIVDPVPLDVVQSGHLACGISKQVQDFLQGPWPPDEVKGALQKELDAKLFSYKGDAYTGKTNVIHAVFPTFNAYTGERSAAQDERAENDLKTVYYNIFREFYKADTSTCKFLRLVPLIDTQRAGPYARELPKMTVKVLLAAFSMLNTEEQRHILTSEVVVCIGDGDFDLYKQALQAQQEGGRMRSSA
mmetsp:Transcript_67210/g.174194  ORF Transcript_67210/g.174194 Transcript_67210/m.174194 type:complete len:699 (+) Transcript_67210:1-2097(+)